MVGVTMPAMTPKEKPPINVVGDVSGRIAIMVDDVIDDVQSFGLFHSQAKFLAAGCSPRQL